MSHLSWIHPHIPDNRISLKPVDQNTILTVMSHCICECRLGAAVTDVHRNCVTDGPNETYVAEVLVRKVPENQQFIDIRIAVLGNVEAGKSTLLGVLTQGELDNGRGRARLNLFRHLHEIQSGRTSSISHEILGFNSKGEVGRTGGDYIRSWRHSVDS